MRKIFFMLVRCEKRREMENIIELQNLKYFQQISKEIIIEIFH